MVVSRSLERLAAFESELAWAKSGSSCLNGEARPEWFRNLVLCLTKTGAIRWAIDLEAKGPLSAEDLGELTGRLQAYAFVLGADDDGSATETESPSLKAFREGILKTAEPGFEKVLASLPKLPLQKGGEPSERLAEVYRGAARGVHKVNTDDSTTTDDLLYWMWLFWQEVSTARSREVLHRWITEMGFVSCSFKLVEKVCREIGFLSKPSRQPTERRKRVGRRAK